MGAKLYFNGQPLNDSNTVPDGSNLIIVDPDKYKSWDFSYEESGNLEKGFFTVDYLSQLVFKEDPSKFWQRFSSVVNLRDLQERREAAGLSMRSLEGSRIFIPSTKSLDKIRVLYKKGIEDTLITKYINVLKTIGSYANYLAKSIIITELIITSMSRSEMEQANIIYNDAIEYPDITSIHAMYKKNTGEIAREEIAKGLTKEQVLVKIIEQGIRANLQIMNF